MEEKKVAASLFEDLFFPFVRADDGARVVCTRRSSLRPNGCHRECEQETYIVQRGRPLSGRNSHEDASPCPICRAVLLRLEAGDSLRPWASVWAESDALAEIESSRRHTSKKEDDSSRTVTECPTRASAIAVARPEMAPPTTTNWMGRKSGLRCQDHVRTRRRVKTRLGRTMMDRE